MRSGYVVCAALIALGCEAAPDGKALVDGEFVSESEPAPASEPVPDGAAPATASVPTTEARFSCDESAHGEPDGLRRLTMTQVRNTLRDLTRWALADSRDADAVLAVAELDALPADRREPTPQDPRGGYRRLDQSLDQRHVEETLRAATALGRALAEPDRLGTVVGPCATDEDGSNDESCLTRFIHSFGARALRRPPEPEDERFYRAVYGGDPTPSSSAYADLIAVLLSAPEFLYFVEHGDLEIADDPGSYQLSAYELAARLSYQFWQTLPDDALWRAAEDGSLLTEEVLAAQVERIMADPRAQETMTELFADWLGLDALPQLDVHDGDPLYVAFAGADLPGPLLRQHAIDDALDMVSHYTWIAPAGLDALFTSELSFARSDDLARIYGVEAWDGNFFPPSLSGGAPALGGGATGQRGGLLTRAWFLLSGSANTRPIQRGVFIRRRLLCDEIAPPPANAMAAVPPALASDKTTREVVEALTEQPGTACASCHAGAINPVGFAFEGFDALGRVRTQQRLFGEHGEPLGALPVDTTSVPQVTANDERVSRGPADLVEQMLQSGKLEACLARNYFRFTFGRAEDVERDGCALERLRARLADAGTLRDLIAEAGLLPELRRRRFGP